MLGEEVEVPLLSSTAMGAGSSSQLIVHRLRKAIARFNLRLDEILAEHHEAIENFRRGYQKWLDKRNEVIVALEVLADKFQDHHKNANIASLTGSSVSFVGGAACIGGLVLAPFTGGLSVALSVGGLMGSTAGTLTMVGARAVEYGLWKEAFEKASRLVEDDCKETLYLSSLIDVCLKKQSEIESVMNDIDWKSILRENEKILSELLGNTSYENRLKRIKNGEGTTEDYFMIVCLLFTDDFSILRKLHSKSFLVPEKKTFSTTVLVAKSLLGSVANIRKCAAFLKSWRTGVNTLKVASKAARFGKGALLGLSMAADVYDIATTAVEIHKKKEIEEVETLRSLKTELVNQKQEIAKYYEALED